MKILLVHNKYAQYGGEDATFVAEKKILENSPHTIETLEFDNRTIKGFKKKLQLIYTLFYNRRSAVIINKTIKKFKPDVIHVHNFFYLISPSIFFTAKKNNIPIIVTIQNYRLICSGAFLMRNLQTCELCIHQKFPIYGIKYKCHHNSRIETSHMTAVTGIHKLIKTWNNKVTKYITVTEFARNKILHSSLNLLPEQVTVKSNSVEDSDYSDFNNRENYFLFIGRLSEEKGIQTLLNAFTGTNINIEIIGDGPLRPLVEDVSSKNVNIKYLGYQNKEFIISKLKKCQALLFTSIWYECLPITILESFSTGTPVVISNIGNLNEIVSHKYNGIHFRTSDPIDLYKVVANFNENRTNYANLYSNARKTYMEKYTPEVNYKNLINLYRNVISEKENT